MEGRKEGNGRKGREGKDGNAKPGAHDHYVGKGRTDAISGHPIQTTCTARAPELGALGREEKEKERNEWKEPYVNPSS